MNKMNKTLEILSSNKRVIILCILIIFTYNSPWFIWRQSQILCFIFTIYLYIVCFRRYKRIKRSVNFLIFFIIFPIFIIIPFFKGFHLSNIIYILSIPIGLSLSKSEGAYVIKYSIKILAIIILISLPFWLINLFLFPLPILGSIDLSQMKVGVDDGSSIMLNYGWFVMFQGIERFRFYSVFDEPGVLGTLSAFLLYAEKYNFKNIWNAIVLIGAIFTLSTAFFVLTFIGIIWIKRFNLKFLLLLFILLFGTIALLVKYYADDPTIQSMIINRLLSEDDFSTLIDNRSSDLISYYFEKFIVSKDLLFGYGYNKLVQLNLLTGSGASYKFFIMEYGFVGLISIILVYFILLKRNFNYEGLGCLIIFILSFFQRPKLWTSYEIIIFSCIIISLSINNKDQKRFNFSNFQYLF